MLKFTLRWVVRCGAVAAVLVIFGCSSSSKSYTLLANLDAMSQTQRIVTAAIDVTGSTCKVSVLTADSATLWSPDCTVNASTATHKSFTIAGQQVEMTGENGSFTVSNSPSLTLPVATHSVATAAINAAYAGTAASAASATAAAKATSKTGKAGKKGAKNSKQKNEKIAAAGTASTAPTAASAAPAAPVTGQAFPTKWALSTYPGHWNLQAQNLGYLVQSADIVINGSACSIDTEFKVKYPPYKFNCIVTSDANNNFTLIFNPYLIAAKTLSPQTQITLDAEGQSISGNIWDAHGFDGWNPAVPPTWRATSGK